VKDEDFTLFVYVFAVQLLGWILIQLLCLVHLLLCVRKKPVDVIYVVSLVLSILVCYLHIENSSEWFDSWIVFFYPYIVVFVMLIGFLANKFVDGWKAASEESRELREKDKNENKLPV
jgi:cell division protein FtsW (lipid II flippase)